MAYRISRRKPVGKSVRKVAREQIDRAIAEIGDERLDRHQKVHQVRKRCKKLRGLLRLVRPLFDGYRDENRFFRDLARELSALRDAKTLVVSFDALLARAGPQPGWQRFEPVRRALVERLDAAAGDDAAVDGRLAEALARLRQARRRVAHWRLDADGFAAIEPGLRKSLARSRKALRRARAAPTAEHFHDWRKRVKVHRFHLDLLRRLWPEMMTVRGDAASGVADLLGEEHDLAVLRGTLRDAAEQHGGVDELQPLFDLIERRRAELRAQALAAGERLLAEKPKALAARFDRFWTIWRAA